MITDKTPIIIKDIHGKPNGEGSICYITLETFKENLERDLSKPKAEPLTVIEFYRKTYIEKALLIKRIQTIYINKKHNKPSFVLPIFLSIAEELDLDNTQKAVDVLILLEDYLNDIEKTFISDQPQQDATTPETDLQTKIKLHFDFFQKNCPRKHKKILKDEDFEKLINWTILFFENDFKVPKIDEPISNVNTNKTFAQGAFKALFNQLCPSHNYPNSLFEFYKNAFKPYANDTKNNFDKARINDEVNKLMNIEY